MPYQPLYEPTDYFQPFPEPEAVFSKEVSIHFRYLLPLATLSLECINPAWSGQVHFIQPIEPQEDVIGFYTPAHHNYYCRPNWIAFHLDDKNRCTFATDWDYFLGAATKPGAHGQNAQQTKALQEHYEEARASYEKNRAHFQKFGVLHSRWAKPNNGQYAEDDRVELLNEIGGMPGWGNWSEIGKFPLSKHLNPVEDDGTLVVPRAEDGSDFTFIGWLHAFNYVEAIGCSLFLFYHPVHRIALETFDWS